MEYQRVLVGIASHPAFHLTHHCRRAGSDLYPRAYCIAIGGCTIQFELEVIVVDRDREATLKFLEQHIHKPIKKKKEAHCKPPF